MKLTQSTVADAKCPPGRKDMLMFDESLPGFGLRVTRKGKHFLVQYRGPLGLRRMTLGSFGEITPDEGRRRAKIILGAAAAGRDPFKEREDAKKAAVAEQATERAKLPLRAIIEAWVDANRAKRRPLYLSSVTGSLTRHLGPLLDKKADSISQDEAQAVIEHVFKKAGPVAANRCLSYARAVYGWALKARKFKLTTNPFAGLQSPGHETSRDRVLTDDEIGMIWRAALKQGWPGGPYVRLLLLSLARRNEISEARWSEVSEDRTTWTLPAARVKNGKAHITHLPPAARDILESLPRLKDSDFVFTTTGKTGVSGFSKFKAAIDAAITAEKGAAIPPWTFHDFRRAGVSWLAKAGFPPHVADRLLNHVEGTINGVQAVYQRHEFLNERAVALDAWAAHVIGCGLGQQAAPNVVQLRSA